MKKIFTLLGIGLLSFYGQSQTLDQSNTASTGSGWLVNSGGYISSGQSFTCGLTGDLSSVVINIDASNGIYPLIAGDFVLNIRNGAGFGGTIIGSETFTITGSETSGDFTINITSTISLTSGNVYTYEIDEISGTGQLMLNASSDTYAGGVLYNNVGTPTAFASYDYKFKTYMNVPCSIADQTVTATSTDLCLTNTGTTITTGSSETGLYYYLRDNANDTIVDGPIAGTGNGLTFNTGVLNSSMSYNVYADTDFAIDLPSGDDYIDFNTPFNTYANEITVESWVYTQNAGDDVWAGQSTPSLDNMGTNVWLWHGGIFYVNDNGTWRGTGIPSLPQGWTHIATVANADSLSVYFNGVLVQSSGLGTGVSTQIVNNSNSKIHLGHDPRFPAGTAGRNSNVAFDNFRVWNVAKSATEIASNYTSCLTGTETNLQVLSELNEGSGVAVTSLTGSDATIINPTTSSNWIVGVNSCSSCNLEMTSIVTVTVQDILAPVADVATLVDTTATCEVTSLTAPTATDNCSANVTVTNDATLPINTVGTTVVTWTYDDGNGNTSTQTQNVIINAPVIDITTSTSGLTISANNTTATAYQWIDCGNSNAAISGETNASYTATVNGDYAVIVFDGNCSDTSLCVTIADVGIDDNNGVSELVELFPNPNNGEFTISTTENNVAITVYSIDGKIIVNNLKITEANQLISLGDIEAGVYFVRVMNENNQKTMRLVVE